VSIEEIVHTCSNEKVAQAAVASLGIAFASRIKSAAEFRGITIGAFAAKVVRAFGADAQACDRRAIDRAMYRSDQPILRGLEIILERGLEESSPIGPSKWARGDFRHAAASFGCMANPAG